MADLYEQAYARIKDVTGKEPTSAAKTAVDALIADGWRPVKPVLEQLYAQIEEDEMRGLQPGSAIWQSRIEEAFAEPGESEPGE